MSNKQKDHQQYDNSGNAFANVEHYQEDDLRQSLPETKAYSLQEAYVKVGGMGRFQYFASVILILGFISGCFMGQSLQFLTLQPKYECIKEGETDWKKAAECVPLVMDQPNGFCNPENKLIHRINYTADTSLDNWFSSMHLACTSKPQIGLIGSMQFVGWAIASCFLPRLADIYGRKPIFLMSILLQLLSIIATFFISSVEMTITVMFFLGFSGVGRCSICFLYLMELLPASKQTLVGTILQMNNGLVAIYMAVYFWVISRDWHAIEIFASSISLINPTHIKMILCTTLFLPESPKFYLSKQRWAEARGAITRIAKFNGEEVFTGKFDREKLSAKYNQVGVRQLNQTLVTNTTDEEDNQNNNNENLLKSPISVVKEEQEMKGTLGDLVKVKRNFYNLLLMIYIWIASSFCTYLINFQMKQTEHQQNSELQNIANLLLYLPGNIYVNTLVSSTVDIPISIIAGVIYYKFGVRVTLPIFYVISTFGAILLIMFGGLNPALDSILVMLARCGVKVALDLCQIIQYCG